MNLRETLKFLRSHLRRKVRVCFLSYYGYKLFNEKSSRTFGGVTLSAITVNVFAVLVEEVTQPVNVFVTARV